jgi:hypothetical protein
MAKQLGLTEAHLQSLMELPGTTTVSDLKSRLVALAEWNSALRRGVLPRAAELAWPQEPFRSKFLDVLKRLEMPRFTRRHPKLLGPLIRQFLQLVDEFESELLAAQPDPPKGPPPPTRAPQPPPQQPAPGGGGDQDAQEDSEGQGGGSGEAQAEGADAEPQPTEAAGEAGAEGGDERGEVQAQLEAQEGGQGDATQPEGDPQDASGQEGFAERLAQQMLDKFEGEWSPAVEALEVASRAFDDVDGLLDGPDGFDSSSSVWRQGGWREVDALRRRLESLRELRDLVRSLGRGGGKGPLKRAPEVVWAAGRPPGVVRSEQSPEETRGLSRSGDLSRMLPSEARLLAAGWPTSRRAGGRGGGEGGKESGGESGGESGDSGIGVGLLLEGGEVAGEGGGRAEAGAQGGSRAARMLFMARRAERMLMSYERAGWVEDEPSRATGRMEVRPAAELGPIIVCLDTSGEAAGGARGRRRRRRAHHAPKPPPKHCFLHITPCTFCMPSHSSAPSPPPRHPAPRSMQAPCTAPARRWPRRWRWSACAARTARAAAATSTPSPALVTCRSWSSAPTRPPCAACCASCRWGSRAAPTWTRRWRSAWSGWGARSGRW